MTGNDDKPNNNETPEQPDDKALGISAEESTEVQHSEAIKVAEEEKPEPAIESTPEDTPSKLEEEKSGGKGFLFLLLIFILLLAVLAAGGYFGWQEYQKQIARLEVLEGNAAEQMVNQQALTKQLNVEQQQWLDEQKTLQTEQFQSLQEAQVLLQQRLDSHSARIQGLAGTSRQDWLLAEVRYLLRLANQRLLVEQNTLGAQGLLEAADNILKTIDDNGLLPVRDAVAKELIALKIADTIDKEGLYLKISAVKEQIQTLPLIPFLQEDKTAEAVKIFEENESVDVERAWYQVMLDSIKSAFTDMSQLIQIRQHDTAPELLISEQQQYQVVNHLTLMLEQAQYALLHEKKGIYRDSFSKAQEWWSIYYAHYNEYEVVKGELTNLKQQAITQTLPDISRSSRLISEYIEQFHQINSSTTVTTEPEETPVEETN